MSVVLAGDTSRSHHLQQAHGGGDEQTEQPGQEGDDWSEGRGGDQPGWSEILVRQDRGEERGGDVHRHNSQTETEKQEEKEERKTTSTSCDVALKPKFISCNKNVKLT